MCVTLTLIAIIGGISSSSVSESMLPFCWRPFILAGSKTISGASAYDFGSVLGRNTRLLYGSLIFYFFRVFGKMRKISICLALIFQLRINRPKSLFRNWFYFVDIPLLTDGGAGVMVKPAFCVNARRSRTVAFDNATESLLILKSTTSSTSIFSIFGIVSFLPLSLYLSLPLALSLSRFFVQI